MENITRTIYGNYIQTCNYLGKVPAVIEYSTLNHKFNVNASELPASGEHPALRYFCIGLGGHTFTGGADLVPRFSQLQHKSTDAALFGHLPFVLRPIDNDLSDTERQTYALRVQENYAGLPYYAYYLRRLDTSGAEPLMQYHTLNAGVEVTTPFVPTNANLEPDPTTISAGMNVVSGDTTSVIAKLGITFTTAQINEILNATKIIYGDESYAIISEIGLCTGIDRDVMAGSAGGGTFTQTEAICVQIAAFISTMTNLQTSNRSMTVEMDVGASEPLLALDGA
jgi:hypothetical protein